MNKIKEATAKRANLLSDKTFMINDPSLYFLLYINKGSKESAITHFETF